MAPFTTGLCEHFASQGHDVNVITTFPYYPEWRVWDGYRGKFTQIQKIKGILSETQQAGYDKFRAEREKRRQQNAKPSGN